MIKKFSTLLAFGLAATLLPSAFGASAPLASGGTVAPVPINTTVPGTLVASSGLMAFTNPGNPAIKGTVQEAVYSTATGLDFYYQVTNTSTNGDAFNTVSMLNYTGVTTAVAQYQIAGGPDAPSSANRTAAGDTVNFFFEAPGPGGVGTVGTLAAGTASYFLEIDTNATAYNTSGFVGVIDGGGVTISGAFQPVLTPEPVSLSLLGGGLALLGLARWRRPAKKV